ncbi:uncharacterized protein LOC129589910 isoform X2 [Paramacrobiotus metropolitanus]|uniref:uncharacterized protein LOC129589910 isoform X2 n=1 Tax=Paramacrobiotus metropolitanus TaxID=2943436 RepID=UPI002445EC79|nr:uncharacterized protein LOC129589910 isoform X2 [Paramacrobiotus metropolitanus]
MLAGMQPSGERYLSPPVSPRKSVIVHTNSAFKPTPLPIPKVPETPCVPLSYPTAEVRHPTLAGLLRNSHQPLAPPTSSPKTQSHSPKQDMGHPLHKHYSAHPVPEIVTPAVPIAEYVPLTGQKKTASTYTPRPRATTTVASLIQLHFPSSSPPQRRDSGTAGALMETVIRASLDEERERNNYNLLRAARSPDVVSTSTEKCPQLHALLSDNSVPVRNAPVSRNFGQPSAVAQRQPTTTVSSIIQSTRLPVEKPKRTERSNRTVAELILQAQYNEQRSNEQMELLKKVNPVTVASNYSTAPLKKRISERARTPEAFFVERVRTPEVSSVERVRTSSMSFTENPRIPDVCLGEIARISEVSFTDRTRSPEVTFVEPQHYSQEIFTSREDRRFNTDYKAHRLQAQLDRIAERRTEHVEPSWGSSRMDALQFGEPAPIRSVSPISVKPVSPVSVKPPTVPDWKKTYARSLMELQTEPEVPSTQRFDYVATSVQSPEPETDKSFQSSKTEAVKSIQPPEPKPVTPMRTQSPQIETVDTIDKKSPDATEVVPRNAEVLPVSGEPNTDNAITPELKATEPLATILPELTSETLKNTTDALPETSNDISVPETVVFTENPMQQNAFDTEIRAMTSIENLPEIVAITNAASHEDQDAANTASTSEMSPIVTSDIDIAQPIIEPISDDEVFNVQPIKEPQSLSSQRHVPASSNVITETVPAVPVSLAAPAAPKVKETMPTLSSDGWGQALIMDDVPLDLYSIVKRRHASSSSSIIQSMIDENIEQQIGLGKGKTLRTPARHAHARTKTTRRHRRTIRHNSSVTHTEFKKKTKKRRATKAYSTTPSDAEFSENDENSADISDDDTDSVEIPLPSRKTDDEKPADPQTVRTATPVLQREIQPLSSSRTNCTIDRISVIADRCCMNVLPDSAAEPVLLDTSVSPSYRVRSLKELCSTELNKKEKKPAFTTVHPGNPLSPVVWNAPRERRINIKKKRKRARSHITFKRPKKKQPGTPLIQSRKPFSTHCPYSGLPTISPFLPPAAAQYVQRALEQELSQRKSPAQSRNASRATSVINAERPEIRRRSHTPVRATPKPLKMVIGRSRSLRSSNSVSEMEMPEALPEFDSARWMSSKSQCMSFGMPLPANIGHIFTPEFVGSAVKTEADNYDDIMELAVDAEALNGSALFLVAMEDGSFGIVSIPETSDDSVTDSGDTISDIDINDIPPLRITDDKNVSSCQLGNHKEATFTDDAGTYQHKLLDRFRKSAKSDKFAEGIRKRSQSRSPDYEIVPSENDTQKITIKIKQHTPSNRRAKRRKPTGWDHERPKKRKVRDSFWSPEPDTLFGRRQSAIFRDPYEFPDSPQSVDKSDTGLTVGMHSLFGSSSRHHRESLDEIHTEALYTDAKYPATEKISIGEYPNATDIMETTLSSADTSSASALLPSSPTESATKSSISDDEEDEEAGKLEIAVESIDDAAHKVSISLDGGRPADTAEGPTDDTHDTTIDQPLAVAPAYEFNRYETVLLGAEIDMQSETSSIMDTSVDLESAEPVLISIPEAGETALETDTEINALLGSITEKPSDSMKDEPVVKAPVVEVEPESDNRVPIAENLNADTAGSSDISLQFSSTLLQLLDANDATQPHVPEEATEVVNKNEENPAISAELQAKRKFVSRFGPPLKSSEKPLPAVAYDSSTESITEHIKTLSAPRPPLLPTPTTPPITAEITDKIFKHHEPPYKRLENFRRMEKDVSENARPMFYNKHNRSMSPFAHPRQDRKRIQRLRYDPIRRQDRRNPLPRNKGNSNHTHFRTTNTRSDPAELQCPQRTDMQRSSRLPRKRTKPLCYADAVYAPDTMSFASTLAVPLINQETATRAHCVQQVRHYVTDAVCLQEAVTVATPPPPAWLQNVGRAVSVTMGDIMSQPILHESYEKLQVTPYGNLIVESIKCAGDDAGFTGFAVQFQGFPSVVALPAETMETYFIKDLMQYYATSTNIVPEDGQS